MDAKLSRSTLRKAWEFGHEMARREPRIRPVLTGAQDCPTYARFVGTHRYNQEHTREFEPWNDGLLKIIEAECRRLRLEVYDPPRWGTPAAEVSMHIRVAFWYGWEVSVGLQKLYEQHMQAARRAAAKPQVLRVFNPEKIEPIRPLPVIKQVSETDRWDSLADKLFEGRKAEDHDPFWDIVTPEGEFANANPNRTPR